MDKCQKKFLKLRNIDYQGIVRLLGGIGVWAKLDSLFFNEQELQAAEQGAIDVTRVVGFYSSGAKGLAQRMMVNILSNRFVSNSSAYHLGLKTVMDDFAALVLDNPNSPKVRILPERFVKQAEGQDIS